MRDLDAFLAGVAIAPDVTALRPDYRAVVVAADGLDAGPSDAAGDELLRAAEEHARAVLGDDPVERLPEVAAWRDAYRAFGARPQRTRNSLEALLRRSLGGLPRVNRLTDLYNAISVRHLIPLGGEDLDAYSGAARLTRAAGDEVFDTTADGVRVVEHPEPGEVVWRDDGGVTCRRWNWRQGVRTRLRDGTAAAFFVLDVLDPVTDERVDVAVAELAGGLRQLGADVRVVSRTVRGTVG